MDRKRRGIVVIIITAALLLIAAVIVAAALIKPSVYTVGKNIKSADITEVYFTRSSSVNPPYYQRYRIYTENGKYMFYHEKREGDTFPLTEKDITVSGSFELSEEEKSSLFDCLDGGKVRKRTESVDSGSDGPWVYLYWKGDKSKYQELSFASYDKEAKYEALCEKLKNSK